MNKTTAFTSEVWDFYGAHSRDLPWRQSEADGSFSPYKILISEVMLQQTQVARVIPKYNEFLAVFPTVNDLAGAQFADVLQVWNGLGYNRRAKFLHQAAQQIVATHTFDWSFEALCSLPGIGKNTAAAIRVYAYNEPREFIETNIRTVFIHHFFQDKDGVSDKEIIELVKKTLPQEQDLTRQWYWALMDYGTYIKQTVGNVSKRSKHYVRQSAFEGSRRQLRAQVLRSLLDTAQTKAELAKTFADERLDSVLKDLQKEQLVIHKNNQYKIA